MENILNRALDLNYNNKFSLRRRSTQRIFGSQIYFEVIENSTALIDIPLFINSRKS